MSENNLTEPHPIAVEFYSRKTTKAFQLINNADPNFSLDAKRQWYNYDFANPVYILEVSVAATGYESWNEIDFEIDHIDGTKHQQSVKVGSGKATVAVGKLASSFRIRPIEKVFGSPKIQKITVVGFTLDEFHAFEWSLRDLDRRKKDIEGREQKIAAAEATDKEKAETRASTDSEIGKSRAELEKLKNQSAEAQTVISGLRDLKSKLDDELRSLEVQRSNLSKKVSENESKLQTLKTEIRLFPSEIADFVREGDRSAKQFLLIALPFAIVIAIVASSLFWSAIDLTQLWNRSEEFDIWSVFLTRLPFVIVALTVLEVCGYIVGRLVSEVIKINRQRLSLSKLSIIARDVSNAAAHGTDIKGDELFDREVKLKMALLHEHMKEYVGQEFEYKGTFISSALKATGDAIAKRLGGPN